MSASTLTRAEPAYRAFEVEVVRARRLSPSFLRMTFSGDDLALFAADGFDQRIKLVLPAACGARVDPGLFSDDSWFETWRAMPDDERYPLRTYTVRAVRQAQREVDVDVVLHGVEPGAVTTRGCGLAELLGCACSAQAGPAVRWCAAARAGDPIVLIGPNARFEGPAGGIEWQPPADARTVLLAGDETAVPAVCAIVEQLPADARGHAFLEVPTEHDVLDVRAPAGVELHWLPRRRVADGGATAEAEHGSLLAAAVRAAAPSAVATTAPRPAADVVLDEVDVDHGIMWEVPEQPLAADGLYAWVAGEAGVVKELRRFLVRDLGVDRRSVAFMGYWRHGRAEAS
ncbi:siderophore-interacting protein [Actinotalea solisilvae]|uniref:siderophore-interacting protein n=1 Tax=Actinotalea solisilvae TaxID=2072922 RepID=UPI0018F14463|nr:siderophore-interacting protein [Actinotalea solisilvae]